MAEEPARSLATLAQVEQAIVFLRGHRVMLDTSLAALYGVPVHRLNEQVRRNLKRFPRDFMFQLNEEEARISRSQFAILSSQGTETTRVSALRAHGKNLKYLPFAFTEQGVAMLSSVLRSPRAVRVNIEIMRAFVRLRQFLLGNAELARRLDELEGKYDVQFRVVFDAIRELMTPPAAPRKRIGFETDES